MSKFADFLQRQRAALKAEATALTTAADKDNDGKLSAEQETRFNAIEADIATIDAQLAASQQPAAETPEQVAMRVRNEVADITAACAIAGKPARASAFIKDGTPLSQVVSTLHAEAAAAGETINPHNPGNPGSIVKTKPIPTASEIYAKRAQARADQLRN